MKLILPLIASAAAWKEVVNGAWGNVQGRVCETHNIVAEACFHRGTGATGCITFTQNSCNGKVQISGEINLNGSTGEGRSHGWHIHQYGNTQDGCGPDFTGGHFDPYNVAKSKTGIIANGGSDDENDGPLDREIGQLGNIVCNNGVCSSPRGEDKVIKLHGFRSILGRSVVIHLNPEVDDVGGSGDRIACATVTLTSWTRK
jgi:Cu/Zn superoxide dismutase